VLTIRAVSLALAARFAFRAGHAARNLNSLIIQPFLISSR
jgi:hypothetical protein